MKSVSTSKKGKGYSSPDFENEDEVEKSDTFEFQKKARSLTVEELDRDVAELSNDVKFLESQLQADLTSYSSAELAIAQRKIANRKRRLEILEAELTQRGRVCDT